MDEEMSNLIEIIPLISNTDNGNDPAILQIYETNAAFFHGINDEDLHSM